MTIFDVVAMAFLIVVILVSAFIVGFNIANPLRRSKAIVAIIVMAASIALMMAGSK